MTIACVHHYLERQAQSRPESILLIEGAARTTYAQIEAGANRWLGSCWSKNPAG